MPHPFAGQARSSSQDRMRRVSGRGGGGGSSFTGSSNFKRYSPKDGEVGSYDSHEKKYVGKANGGKVKARADFARGGRTKMAKGGLTKEAEERLMQRVGLPGEYKRPIGIIDAMTARGEGWDVGVPIHHGPLGGEGGDYARGGRTKKGNVNIVIHTGGRRPPAMPMLPPGGAPAAQGAPPPPVGGPPPGAGAAPPGGPPPGGPMGAMPPGGGPGGPPGAGAPNPAQAALGAIAGGAGPMPPGGPMQPRPPGQPPFKRGGKVRMQEGGSAGGDYEPEPPAKYDDANFTEAEPSGRTVVLPDIGKPGGGGWQNPVKFNAPKVKPAEPEKRGGRARKRGGRAKR